MTLAPYEKDKHAEFLKSWLRIRHIDPKLVDEVPEKGFIVTKDNLTICAAFLREVEGDYFMIDSLVTNPAIEPMLRNEAIDIVVSKLIATARMFGVSKLMATTVDKNTLERAFRFGFRELPHKVITLSLGEEK